ncbi:hypothetical protein BH708_14890 [Brachybacterium sp. P6-10-X1]|uniref:hypothetical protein n=1 Tax=Brachybacterium sp. P6-10-X1 TaxID=1903186 RepID=UPI00097176B5|nr:hypothetical protein [Brachybacterium sp. P6-10-X1]APX33784.1 hypothetical protein BH708_14890 [Brachybacterium sp. P6-10-X1]
MTTIEPPGGEHVRWDGSPEVLTRIRDLLISHSSRGTLRIVLQQLTLHEGGKQTGIHEVIDAVLDVGGNLVATSLAPSVREDPQAATRLDAALARLRAEVVAQTEAQPEALEVVIDGDGRREARIAFDLEISAQDLADHHPHPALRDGAHHILHEAPALDELRDRLSAPPPSLLRRGWDALRGVGRRDDAGLDGPERG